MIAPSTWAFTWAWGDAPRRWPALNAQSVWAVWEVVPIDTSPVEIVVGAPPPEPANDSWVSMPTAPDGARSVSPAERPETLARTRAMAMAAPTTAGDRPKPAHPTT